MHLEKWDWDLWTDALQAEKTLLRLFECLKVKITMEGRSVLLQS